MNFVVDSNTFRLLGNYYPARFPSLWEKLDLLVSDGRWTSVREVRKELDRQNVSQHIDLWAEANKGIFLPPTASDLENVAAILAVKHFQHLIGERQRLRGWPVADPFIIARAMNSGACVVTEEGRKRNAAKIPNVCAHFGVECINFEELMDREGWTF